MRGLHTTHDTRVRYNPYPAPRFLYPSTILNPRLLDTYQSPPRIRVPYSEAIPVRLHHSNPPHNPTKVHYSETVPLKVHNSYPLPVRTYRNNHNTGKRQTYPNTVVNLNAYHQRYPPNVITGTGYPAVHRTTIQTIPPRTCSSGIQQTYLQSAQQAAKSTVKNPPRVKTNIVSSNPIQHHRTKGVRYHYIYPPRVSTGEFHKYPNYYVCLSDTCTCISCSIQVHV